MCDDVSGKAEEPQHPGSSRAPARILIVDDTPNNLQAFKTVLADLGELVLADSGEEALGQTLLEGEFAVILMDMRMPGMDGLEAGRLIRQRRKTRHTPIVFLSARDQTPVEIAKAYLAGAIDFLFTPIDPLMLRRKVAGFVELYQRSALSRAETESLRHANELLLSRIKELEGMLVKRSPPELPSRC